MLFTKAQMEVLADLLCDIRDDLESEDKRIVDLIQCKLGDEGLIPRLALNRLDAQSQAIERYCDASLLKRSKVLKQHSGATHYHLKKLDA